MKVTKKILGLALAAVLVVSAAGCSSKSTQETKEPESQTTDTSATTTEETSTTGGKTVADGVPTFDSIELGVDYTDVTASIKVLTHRTDLIDTVFQDQCHLDKTFSFKIIGLLV